MFTSCLDDSESQRQNREENEMRDAIVDLLSSASTMSYTFTPRDTIIELPNETNLFVAKNSFLTQDSSIYLGDVKIKYEFNTDSSELFAQQFRQNSFGVRSIYGLIKIDAVDNNGRSLIVNKESAPSLFFHPKLNLLACTYFEIDSQSNQYSTPLYFYEKYKDIPISKTIDREGDLGPNALFMDSSSEGNEKTENYNGTKISKKELIGYEMTLKDFGTYFISRDDNTRDLQTTSINVDLTLPKNKLIDWSKVSLFLVTNQIDYNYLVKAQNDGTGLFKFVKSVGNLDLKLPLDNNYKFLAYGIDGDKCYLFKKRGVKLKSSNSLSYQLKQVSFEKLKSEIRSF